MYGSASDRVRLSVVGAWRDAWRIAESNPLLLLVTLVVMAVSVEGCAWGMGAIVKSFPAAAYGPIASWLFYIAIIALNQLLIASLSAGIALLLLIKRSEVDPEGALPLRRGPIFRYFFWVSIGWLAVLFATQIVAVPANIVLQIVAMRSGEDTFGSPVTLLGSIVIAVVEAGIASLFFLGLPDVLAGRPRRPRRGERTGFFLVCSPLFLAAGLAIGVVWMFLALRMDYAENYRFLDWKYALEGWWVVLLSFAARPQFGGAHPSITAVFD
jgi:hypothetical protein